MCEKSFITLRVIHCSMPNSPTWCPNSHLSTIPSPSTPISQLGSFIDNLIKGWKNIVSKLDFRNRVFTLHCQPNGKTDDSLFRKRSVEYSILSKFFIQILSTSEDSPKFDILSKSVRLRVFKHELIHSLIYCLVEI